jgi:hypothetical protein
MSNKQDKKKFHPETFFLPPLTMVLTFFDKESQHDQKDAKSENPDNVTEKDLEKLIEKLSEKEE